MFSGEGGKSRAVDRLWAGRASPVCTPGSACVVPSRCAGGIAVSRDACAIPAPSLAAPGAGKVGAGDFPSAILLLHQTTLSAVGTRHTGHSFSPRGVNMYLVHNTRRHG